MTIHLRKMYVDCRFGQLHLHTSFPSSGGFDELTPVLCVAPPSLTGRAFRPLLRDLGRDRSVYAPDLPGSGESDAPDHAPMVADQAAAFIDLIESLRLKQVDVIGYQAGSLAAIELALAKPERVRRLILIGVPSSDGSYQVGERLPLLRLPVMILRARDEFWESTGRTESLLRDARRAELSPATGDVLDADADEVARLAHDFLDR
ncbi:MAG: alpha/beta hydrolase [Gammaproteobacteria bacterium]|nr:alpha/beta hydrolase [Gammaproteobacteria bacterium]MDH5226804.1 alpha/beta hydrolase [Gammaproteobacteria bacterium]